MKRATRRVVVTGMGAVTPIGANVQQSWENALKGVSGIVSLKGDDEFKNLKSQVGGRLHKDYNENEHHTSFSNARVFSLAHAAFKEALADSEYKIDSDKKAFMSGIIIGNQFGANENIIKISNADRGEKKDTTALLKSMNHMVPGLLAIDYNFQGPTASASTASSSGAVAIGEAFRKIKYGYADFMMCGGVDFNLNRPFFQGMENFGATCQAFNDTPESASRPFDQSRAGPVMADGAGIIALEDFHSAIHRGAKIYAEIIGYGNTTDAYHILRPREDGFGIWRAARLACIEAGITPRDIDHINSHATATPVGDASEVLAFKKFFTNAWLNDSEYLIDLEVKDEFVDANHKNTDHLKKISIFAPKGHIGHTFCAAGGVETIFGLKSIETGEVPATLNLKDLLPEGEGMNFVMGKSQKQDINYMMKTSLAFGGHNNVLIFKKHD